MDDMNAFEKQLAGEVERAFGPPHPVDVSAIVHDATTQSPKWRFQSMFSATKFVVAGAIVALFGGFLLSGVLTQQPSDEMAPAAATTSGPGAFSPAGSLGEARYSHTATRLPDGRVLVVGGEYFGEEGDTIALNAVPAEVWDPATAAFNSAGPLIKARSGHTATSLPDGRVLVVGGYAYDECDGYCFHYIADAEVWDPATASFGPAGSLVEAREGHTSTLLPDGRVLIVGGADGSGKGKGPSAEVWDPETARFSPAAGSLAKAGDVHVAALRPDGRVLLVGEADGFSPTVSAGFWDPEAAAFASAGSVAYTHDGQPVTDYSLTPLPDGHVLIVGGEYEPDPDSPDEVIATAAVWDPETATLDAAGSLGEARSGHTATILSDGHVLVTGGRDSDFESLALAEVWDPRTSSFGPAGSLAEAREFHTVTSLPDGRVLIVGGMGRDSILASAEVWSP